MILDKNGLIEIKSADNGFIVKQTRWENTDDNGNKIFDEEIEVIEEDNSQEGEKEAIRRLLHLVAEKTGYFPDKYSEHNLRISFDEKGRGVE